MRKVADDSHDLESRPSDSRLGLDRGAWSVAALGLVLRLIWVVAFARIPSGLSDPLLYHGYGIRIARGVGYRSLAEDLTAYYPPGYPYFLGGLYKLGNLIGLTGHRDLLVGVAQSVLWAVSVLAVIVAARAVFERRVALIAGLLLACWPNLITYASAWLSESLFVCLFALALAGVSIAARSEGRGARWWWSLAVAALGFAGATMVRPQVLLGLPLLALAWLWGSLGWRRVLALGVAVGIATAALVVPWTVRNEAVFHHLVFISTNGGDNLCVGFHPGASGAFRIPPYCNTGEFYTEGRDAEYRRNVQTRQRALDFIRSEPLAVPWLSVRKLFYTYRSDDDGLLAGSSYGADQVLGSPWRGIWLTISHTYYAVVMVAALIGLVMSVASAVRTRPRDAAVLALVAMTIAGALVPVMFFGDPRFKVPTTPLFTIFAAVALAGAWQRFRPSPPV